MEKVFRTGGTLKVVRVERIRSPFGDELRIRLRVGRLRFYVELDAKSFSEEKFKKAVAEKLACEFGFQRAKSLTGRKYDLKEIVGAGIEDDG